MLWGLRPVEQQAAYGLAVDRIKRQIHMGFIMPGERLPAERKLAEEVGLSRVT
ncbi:MAG: GntR family transcriptional regulator, partial [Pseudomonadota bacterium]|nr:GntR family transcriptional regulator [Pseudomonadota bacterium]